MSTYRSITVSQRPVVEPVSLAEAKHHCRVDSEADDVYIASLITAAREWVEAYLDESVVKQQLTMKMDGFPAAIELPRPPMVKAGAETAVTIVYTLNQTGQTTTLPESEYRVDRDSQPGCIRPLYGRAWPAHLTDYNAVTVTWWAGRGDDGKSAPQGYRNAILWLVGLWYEKRMAADAGGLSEIPFGVKAMLDASRWGSY